MLLVVFQTPCLNLICFREAAQNEQLFFIATNYGRRSWPESDGIFMTGGQIGN